MILHHLIPNSPENVFLVAFVMMKLKQEWTNCQLKLNIEQFSKWRRKKDVSYGFHWNASLHYWLWSHANKKFLNGNAIADELPNIQLNLPTVWDASLPGIQNYFIYSSRIIGKLSLISIEKFGF